MNKLLVIVSTFLVSAIAHSNHCPLPQQLFIKQGNKLVTLTPPGWQWTKSWGGEPEFKSENVTLNYAMWDSQRINPEDQNRVHCIYGNPIFDGSHSGGLLQTVDVIERKSVEAKLNWVQYGDNYFRCESSDVFKCLFG